MEYIGMRRVEAQTNNVEPEIAVPSKKSFFRFLFGVLCSHPCLPPISFLGPGSRKPSSAGQDACPGS